jgi:hypothetical protein
MIFFDFDVENTSETSYKRKNYFFPNVDSLSL